MPSSLKGTKAQSHIQQQAFDAGVDLGNLPKHIAIIMDGNGRWASKNGFERLRGHHQGYRKLRDILIACSDLGIAYLTVYAFSAENWRRPKDEVIGLMKLIERAARDELRLMHQNNVRVNVIGRLEDVPESLRQALTEGVETTKNNSGITFTLAINYGGRTEIVDAVRQIVQKGIAPQDIDEETIQQHLYLATVPDPDLMIRTAGEMRWSNFLIWQAAYSELFVTDVSWPEFTDSHLLQGILEYQHRTRKFGGL